ncbi:hypothetical protein NQZ68_013908 [Dissostichus eleginoides]|nr:hypothetical protein NQZ68_013908 [Dissostichus eleginoides]
MYRMAAGTEWTPEIVVPPLLSKLAFLPMRRLAKHSQILPFATLSPHTSPGSCCTSALIRIVDTGSLFWVGSQLNRRSSTDAKGRGPQGSYRPITSVGVSGDEMERSRPAGGLDGSFNAERGVCKQTAADRVYACHNRSGP